MTLKSTVTEAAFQDAVIDLARIGGWLVHHTRPARTGTGWTTPIQGDAGFPDLVLAHPQRGLIFAELKTTRGRLTDAQERWIDALGRASEIEFAPDDGDASVVYAEAFRVFVWNPTAWPQIVATLTPGART